MKHDILENMQWLSQKGFKPDMWVKDWSLEEDLYDGLEILDVEQEEDEYKPYFSESRLMDFCRDLTDTNAAILLIHRGNLLEKLLDRVVWLVETKQLKAEDYYG